MLQTEQPSKNDAVKTDPRKGTGILAVNEGTDSKRQKS